MPDLSDKEILERLHRGDSGALGLLYISQVLAELRKLSEVLILFTSLNSINNLF